MYKIMWPFLKKKGTRERETVKCQNLTTRATYAAK